MNTSIRTFLACLLGFLLNACAPGFEALQAPPPIGPSFDHSVVRGVALVSISSQRECQVGKFIKNLFMPSAYADSNATTTVTYNLSSSVEFQIDTSNLLAGLINGNTLSLGSVAIVKLKDNNLKQCGSGGSQKCTTALIRVYTTGSIAGFVNISDSPNYGVPVYVGSLNPNTALPLNSPGVQVQTLTGISSSKHTVLLSDFPNPVYSVNSDFSNAGSGSYRMNFVVEYALAQ